MPMPELDPARYVQTVLSDPTHKLPMIDKGGRLFSQDPAAPETVDIFDPFYAGLLADGSIRRACLVASAPKAAAVEKTATEADGEPVDPPKVEEVKTDADTKPVEPPKVTEPELPAESSKPAA